MKRLTFLLLPVALLTSLAFADKKQDQDRPCSITIQATPEAVKAELMRLNSDKKLCEELSSQLTFCTPPKKMRAQLAHAHLEYVFTLISGPDHSITINAKIDSCDVNVFGYKRRSGKMTEQMRDDLQRMLDNLKEALSPPS